jgi:hypothetical protein
MPVAGTACTMWRALMISMTRNPLPLPVVCFTWLDWLLEVGDWLLKASRVCSKQIFRRCDHICCGFPGCGVLMCFQGS